MTPKWTKSVIFGKNDPQNDPGDPPGGVLKIQKQIEYDLEVLISQEKLIKRVLAQSWGEQTDHFSKNGDFDCFPIHLYRRYSKITQNVDRTPCTPF